MGVVTNCREMQGNARGTKGVGINCQGNAGDCRGMQENARGTYVSGCNVPGECRGMPGECK